MRQQSCLQRRICGDRPFCDTVIADTTSATALEDAITEIINNNAEIGVVNAEGGNIKWETGAAHGSTPLVPAGSSVETLIIDGGSAGATFTATGAGVDPIAAKNDGTLVFKNITIEDQSVSYNEGAWELTYLEFDGTLVFENCTFNSGIQLENNANATFTNCTFKSAEDSVYAVWVCGGTATFTDCTFTGTRGLKMHEAYGTDVDTVIVDGCTFENITKKPGIAIGDLDATTIVTVKNSTFAGCQAGDQGKYIYESDTDVTTFDFTLSNNTVK